MNVSAAWRVAGLVTLCLAALLPLVGHWLRANSDQGCALDGLPITATHKVRLLSEGGRAFEFCSIFCAESWLTSSEGRPLAVYVMDEITGNKVDAREAHYARSSVITHRPTRDRRHAFARHNDAQAHAETFRGRVLTGSEKPFMRWLP